MKTIKDWEEKIRSGKMRAEKGLDTSSGSLYFRMRGLGHSDFEAQKIVFADSRPIEKMTKAQMKGKVLAWIEWLKKEDLKFCKECGLSPEKYLDEYTCFRIEDTEVKGGAKGFTFHFDANLYGIINGYRNDGRHAKRGSVFDALTEGTNWSQEAMDASSEFFYVSF